MARRFVVERDATLLEWMLATVAGLSRNDAKNYLKHRTVCVNGSADVRHDTPLAPGDTVELDTRGGGERAASELPFPILFEDESVVAIDKPSGLLAIASDDERGRTAQRLLSDRARAMRTPTGRVFVVHRLDRETSGVLLFAQNEAAKRALQDGWADVEKTYLAVVEGTPAPREATMIGHLREDPRGLRVHLVDGGPGSQRAVTHYRVLETRGGHSLLEVRIDTGRKHQIRVQLAGIKHPVLGDDRYGSKATAPRLALHAARLTFPHPVTGAPISVESPLPSVLKRLV